MALAPDTLTVQVPVPEQPAPDQPVKTEPGAATADRIVVVPFAMPMEADGHAVAQLRPVGTLVTVPVPAPLFERVTAYRVPTALVSAAALLAVLLSMTPDGGATLTVVDVVVPAAPAVPVTVYVTEEPTGNEGASAMEFALLAAPQAAPELATQVHATAPNPDTVCETGAATTAVGPLLVTTTM